MTLQVAAPNKLGQELVRRGLLTNEQLTKAVEAAESTPAPEIDTIFTDVYADMPALLQDQLDGLDRSVDRLREPDRERNPTWPKTRNQICADAVEAALAQRTGRADARERIERLDQTLTTRPYRGLRWENLFVAGLLEQESMYVRAAAAARRHSILWGYVAYYATILREGGRLAELAGDRERAIEAYSRYLDLRSDPEPSVQAEVDEVRRALARLTAER